MNDIDRMVAKIDQNQKDLDTYHETLAEYGAKVDQEPFMIRVMLELLVDRVVGKAQIDGELNPERLQFTLDLQEEMLKPMPDLLAEVQQQMKQQQAPKLHLPGAG